MAKPIKMLELHYPMIQFLKINNIHLLAMCELGVFPIIFRERSFKSRQNPSADFFQGKKRLGRIQYGVFQFTVAEFYVR